MSFRFPIRRDGDADLARRCGIHRGLGDADLQRLFDLQGGSGSCRRFERALKWATRRQDDAGSGLLHAAPDDAWTALLDVVANVVAYAVGVAAYLRSRPCTAAEAFRRGDVAVG
ncbi:hypothetical protein [Embleya sp. NPDC005971]|uniref:hypothetical protein n=1 Tax=Embleya sp. NPDC005971 TaxID=3156724 RepID=UPI0033C0641E